MKFVNFSIASFALLQLSYAQPHKAARHGHAGVHQKKDVTNEVEVLVWVDAEGKPVSTTTETIAVSTSSRSSSSASSITPKATTVASPAPPAVVPPPASNPAPPASKPAPPANPAPATNPAPAPAPPAPAKAPTAPSSGSTSPSSYGLSYSPYNSDGSCKTQAQVNTDFAAFGPSYHGGLMRLYGTDCSQTSTVLAASEPYNMSIFAGIFDINDLASEVSLISSAANGDWSRFHTVSVGNELVNSGTADPTTVVNAIGSAKSLLQQSGYTGPVVTVDTLVSMRSNPQLCHASTYCAVNCHPFFDGSTLPSSSGTFLTSQIATLASAVNDPSKNIVITETGWPTQGQTNGVAIPSQANQNMALSAIKGAFMGNEGGVVLFTAYNDLWKTSGVGQFDAEQWWGMMGNSPSG